MRVLQWNIPSDTDIRKVFDCVAKGNSLVSIDAGGLMEMSHSEFIRYHRGHVMVSRSLLPGGCDKHDNFHLPAQFDGEE